MELFDHYDPETGTFSYLLIDAASGDCAVVDPVLHYAANSGRTDASAIAPLADIIRQRQLNLVWILETHAHADHLSAATMLQGQFGGTIVIGAGIGQVQVIFKELLNLEKDFCTDGSQFGRLVEDGDTLLLGAQTIRALATPGHTPACVSYQVGERIFVGDTLFMPDQGTARCDFPGGDAATLYRSIERLLAFPAETELCLCHDYPVEREACGRSTVAEQRQANLHIAGATLEEFVALREARDSTLDLPRLILPSIQINLRAGHFPPAEADGYSYLKLPLNKL